MMPAPTPPKGFIPFNHEYHRLPDARAVAACPNCRDFRGNLLDLADEGFDDAEAQALFVSARKGLMALGPEWSLSFAGHGAMGSLYLGKPLLREHWSRWTLYRCTLCDCRIWHDYSEGASNHWHYLPTVRFVQLTLF